MSWKVSVVAAVLAVGAVLVLRPAGEPAASGLALPPQLLSRVIQATDEVATVELRCENEIGCSGVIDIAQGDAWISRPARYSMRSGETRRQKVSIAPNPGSEGATVWWREDSGLGSTADVKLERRS